MRAGYLLLISLPVGLAQGQTPTPTGFTVTMTMTGTPRTTSTHVPIPASLTVEGTCHNTKQVDYQACVLTAVGWNKEAASYVATALDANNAALGKVWGQEQGSKDYRTAAYDFYQNLDYYTNKITGFVTFEVAHATLIDDPVLRAAVSSIFEEGLSLQNNPTTAAARPAAPTSLGAYVAAGVAVGVAGLAVGL